VELLGTDLQIAAQVHNKKVAGLTLALPVPVLHQLTAFVRLPATLCIESASSAHALVVGLALVVWLHC
jgi:hypothetical protein